jgi:hypothetical protein
MPGTTDDYSNRSAREVFKAITARFKLIAGIVASLVAFAASLVAVISYFGDKTPSFSGPVGHLQESEEFIDFIYKHDAEIVYLDVYFDSSEFPPAVMERDSFGRKYFALWTDCRNLPEGEEPSSPYCTGVEFGVQFDEKSESTYGYNQGFNYLKGYWAVRTNPGMHQGLLSVTLLAVNAEDSRR